MKLISATLGHNEPSLRENLTLPGIVLTT